MSTMVDISFAPEVSVSFRRPHTLYSFLLHLTDSLFCLCLLKGRGAILFETVSNEKSESGCLEVVGLRLLRFLHV